MISYAFTGLHNTNEREWHRVMCPLSDLKAVGRCSDAWTGLPVDRTCAGCGRPASCVVKRVYTTGFKTFASLFRCPTFNSLAEVRSIYDIIVDNAHPTRRTNMLDIWAPHEHIESDHHHLASLSPKPTPLCPGRTSKMSSKSFMYSFLTFLTTLTFHNLRTARTSMTTSRAPSLFRAMCGRRSTWFEGKRKKGRPTQYVVIQYRRVDPNADVSNAALMCWSRHDYIISSAQHESLEPNITISNPQWCDGDGESEAPPL
jgi:hypothetical protein